MAQQQSQPQSQSQASRVATAAANNGLTTAVNLPAAVVMPAQNSALAAATVGGAAAMLARMSSSNTNFGQYYLRFLRHHSTRASPVTVGQFCAGVFWNLREKTLFSNARHY